ncbi:DUF6542 domain-containing protein [Streptomyces sp. NPDC001941]|uniref:DUF6542 domain-containing protein n=1 Tax=Streptomyces sp. NPDC001941 TaxID=3154659 RepID=UPI0033349478
MEQHRTSPPQPRQRPKGPLAPQGALVDGAAVYRAAPRRGRPVPPVVLALRRLPSPRLTGLGAGLFASAAMLALGCLDWLLFDGAPLVYGLLFLPVSAATALWVRSADLVTAPISVPIAFAVGIVPVAGGTGGFGGQAMAVVTALAVHAGWLYGGTLVAGLITCVRKVRLMSRRQRRTPVKNGKQQNGKQQSAKAAAVRVAPRRPQA